jgi:hypothetical protein
LACGAAIARYAVTQGLRRTVAHSAWQRLHHRGVVGEDDPARVEILQALDPGTNRRQSLAGSLPLRLRSAQLGSVGARGVVRLASEDDGLITTGDDQ